MALASVVLAGGGPVSAETEQRVGEPGWSSDERSVSVWFADPHERAGGLYCGQAEFPDDGALRGRRSFSNPHSRAAPPTQESPWTLKRRSGHHLSPGDRVTWRVWWQPEGGRCVESRTTTREVQTRVGHRPPLFENAEATLVRTPGRDDVTWSFTRHRLADRDPASPGDQRSVCVRLVGHDVAPDSGASAVVGGHPCAAFRLLEDDRALAFFYVGAKTLTPGGSYRVWVVECLGFLGDQCADWAPWRDAHKSTPPLRVPEGPPRPLPLFYGAETTFEFDEHETIPQLSQHLVTLTARSHRLRDVNGDDPGGVIFCVMLVGHTAHSNVTPDTLPGGGVCTPVRHAALAVRLAEDRDQAVAATIVYPRSAFLEAGRTYPVRVYECLRASTGGGACEEYDTANPFEAPDLKVPPPARPAHHVIDPAITTRGTIVHLEYSTDGGHSDHAGGWFLACVRVTNYSGLLDLRETTGGNEAGLGRRVEAHGVDCHQAVLQAGTATTAIRMADGARLVPGVSHGLQYLVCVDKATPPPLACGEWHDWSRYSDDPNHHPWKGAYYKQFVPQE